jgi:hypothetical protein
MVRHGYRPSPRTARCGGTGRIGSQTRT